MRLLLSTFRLIDRAGSETYLLTVAEQLVRLGHEVIVHSIDDAEHSVLAAEHGLHSADGERGLPDSVDAILAQDAIVSFRLAERYPTAPQVFVSHSSLHDLQLPPQLPGLVSAVVVMNEHVRQRVEAMAVVPAVVRLRQPIETKVFRPRAPLPERPGRVLAFGNAMPEERVAAIRAACDEAGVVFERAGSSSSPTHDPASRIAAADIIVGYGRCALEGMACGRAVFVYDRAGGDGWVTADTYGPLEAGGFSGQSDLAPPGPADFDLSRYSPDMGLVNRDLAVRHHRASIHAEELVSVLRDAPAPPETTPAPLTEMSRLVQLQWHSERHALALYSELMALRSAQDSA